MNNPYQYYCARGFIEPGDIVVDGACGKGEGVELFSKIAKKVVGMDRDKNAIKYAMDNHKKDNNYFKNCRKWVRTGHDSSLLKNNNKRRSYKMHGIPSFVRNSESPYNFAHQVL